MDITWINRNAPLAHQTGAPDPAVDRPGDAREVVQAVKALNQTEMFGPENELVFRTDPKTQRLIVRLVNRTTNEVIKQIPAEYLLRLAEDYKNTSE